MARPQKHITNCPHLERKHCSLGLCRECYQKQSYQTNKEVRKQQARDYAQQHPQKYNKANSVRHRHNMSWDEYLERVERQHNACVCGRVFDDTWSGVPRIDHDPKCCPAGKKSCGKCTRGLLCNRCNRVLGLLEKDPHLLPPYLVNYLAY